MRDHLIDLGNLPVRRLIGYTRKGTSMGYFDQSFHCEGFRMMGRWNDWGMLSYQAFFTVKNNGLTPHNFEGWTQNE